MRAKRLFVLAVLAVLPSSAAAGPPSTEVQPVRETLHGVEIVDPYRWLEGSAGLGDGKTDAALDARVSAWTDAQNAYTRSVLDRLPRRQEIEARLRAMDSHLFRWNVMQHGDWTFFHQIEQGRQQPVLMASRSGGEPRVLIDPALADPSGLTTLAWAQPSPDGRLVAFGLFRAGDENATLYLVETETATWLADEIPNKTREAEWLPDGSGFLYNHLADVANPSSRRVRFHRVGTHPRQDRTLIEQDKEGPGAASWGPFAHVSPDGRWAIVGHWKGSAVNDLWVVDLRRWLKEGDAAARRPIVVGQEAQSGLMDVYEPGDPIVGDTLYMTTTLGALNKRVVAVDLNDPDPQRWREVIPEKKDAALQNLLLAGETLVAVYLKDASTRLERFGLDGKPKGELPLPGLGTATITTARDRGEAFLSYSSFNEPLGHYRVNVATGERQLWWRGPTQIDPAALQVEQVWYPSKDGTRVSMFLIHKKGLKLDGCNPTLLMGYGGFGLSMTPGYNGFALVWAEAGGVAAIPNLRGGGEYGEAWHQAGILDRKQNVFDDFIAAAEWLITRRYTRPERLAVDGASNGGLLVGAVVTQRPDLFAAGFAGVPLLDMVRYHRFGRARNWIAEYGSSDDPQQLAFLRRYSPYHNVKEGTRYPAVMMTAGERDERVHPLHARKMTARLQAATAADPEARPVLLWVDRDTGHGMGTPTDKGIAAAVDQLAFLMWTTGMGRECR